MTNISKTMNDARNTMRKIQKQFNTMREEAANAAVQEIIRSDKEFTRRDIANMTGLTMDEVERYIGEYVRTWNNNARPLKTDKKQLTRTYALVREDGTVDMNTMAKIPCRCIVYSAYPDAQVEEEKPIREFAADVFTALLSGFNE